VAVKKNPSTKFSHKFNTKDYWKYIFTNGDLKHKYMYISFNNTNRQKYCTTYIIKEHFTFTLHIIY